MKRLLRSLAVAIGLGLASGAQAIPLSDLFAGQTIQAGDKVFDQWELLFLDASDPGLLPDLANIDVTALDDGGLDPGPGLQFTVMNGALDVEGDDIFAFIDLEFGFRVTPAPGMRVSDNSLAITDANHNFDDDGSNNLGAAIQEWVYDAPGGTELGQKFVTFDVLDDVLTNQVTDSASFAPQDSIWVVKDVFVWSEQSGDIASLTGFSQRFAQTPVTVAEPGILALLVPGLLGVWYSRRRRPASGKA